jgi:hypothetical protein
MQREYLDGNANASREFEHLLGPKRSSNSVWPCQVTSRLHRLLVLCLSWLGGASGGVTKADPRKDPVGRRQLKMHESTEALIGGDGAVLAGDALCTLRKPPWRDHPSRMITVD